MALCYGISRTISTMVAGPLLAVATSTMVTLAEPQELFQCFRHSKLDL